MAFNGIESEQINQCMGSFMEKHRPAPFIRDEIDLQYRVWGGDVLISEVRHINGRKIVTPVVKMTLNRSQNHWKLFCIGKSGQWEELFTDLIPTFSDAIAVVEDAPAGIFFGNGKFR